MIVLILHPSEEKILLDLQNYLLQNINCTAKIPVKNYPLWTDLPELSKDDKNSISGLKETSAKIKKITVHSPVIENQIYCPVEISISDKTIYGKIPLIYFHELKNKKQNEDENINLENIKKILSEEKSILEKFPLKVSVFKLGFAPIHSNNYSVLQEEVWKKIIT